MSSVMREDWIEVLSGEILDIRDGTHDTPKYISEQTYPLVTSKNLKNGVIDFSNIKYISEQDFTEINKRSKVDIGDILFAMIGTIGNPVLVKTEPHYSIKNIGLFKNPLKIIKSELVKYYLDSLNFYSQLEERQFLKGTTQKFIPLGHLRNIHFPLAPLPIQRAIVSKIEALFSDLDNGIANFKKAQEQLKIYRQAVLKKAFEGELTKEWRAKQTNLPTAEELLQKIKEERQNHYSQQIEDWKKAVKDWEKNGKKGKRPSRISKPKEVAEVKESDIENYEPLPNSWKWSRFGNVTYKIGDIDHKMPKTVENGYPYLSTGNLNGDGTIDFSGAKTISKENFERLALKIKPEKGDIIFPRYGTIGRNILIDFDREFLVSYSCAIIKNITSLMSSKFALYYSLSPVIKKEIKRYTVETTQANIGIASIENFVFPLCSTKEQTQIVQEIESRLSVCDKMEQSINESIEKAEALRQSILKKAFEGKLLSQAEIAQCKQAADYEPASELLKKIQAEKLAILQQAQDAKKKKPSVKKK
jgi:type I restriction enzyme S subunit